MPASASPASTTTATCSSPRRSATGLFDGLDRARASPPWSRCSPSRPVVERPRRSCRRPRLARRVARPRGARRRAPSDERRAGLPPDARPRRRFRRARLLRGREDELASCSLRSDHGGRRRHDLGGGDLGGRFRPQREAARRPTAADRTVAAAAPTARPRPRQARAGPSGAGIVVAVLGCPGGRDDEARADDPRQRGRLLVFPGHALRRRELHAERTRGSPPLRHEPRRPRLRPGQPARGRERGAVRPLLALLQEPAPAVPRRVRRRARHLRRRVARRHHRAAPRRGALRAGLRRVRRRLGRPARRRPPRLRAGLERARPRSSSGAG